jgi:HupE / UreJ protein
VTKFTLYALIGLVIAIRPAIAEDRSVSHSDWLIAKDRVTLRFVLPVTEARRLTSRGLPPPSTEKVASYILDRVSVSASGTLCTAIDQGYDIGRIDSLSVGSGLYGFEIIFQCPSPLDLVLRNAVLFERAPQHVDFARIEQDGVVVTQLFTKGREEIKIHSSGVRQAGISEYIGLGVRHILHSLDRICFLAGLLVLLRSRRDLMGLVTGLLLGYAAALGVEAGGFAIPNMPAVESAMGFLVASLAAQSIAWEARRPRIVASVVGVAMLLIGVTALLVRGQIGWLAVGLGIFAASLLSNAPRRGLPILALPAVFGFLDGLVLPGDFAGLELSRQIPFLGLFAFNTGALLGDAFLLGAGVGAALLVRRRNIAAPGAMVKDLAATVLAGLGTFWMLSRMYSL